MHGLRHVLTPGTPTYALLKMAAVTSVFGLQYVLRRRARHGDAVGGSDVHEEPARPRREHPRSKKKKRRRR